MMKNYLFAIDSSSKKNFLIQVLFSTAFTILTSGVFLSGLAVLMGANDVLVSYISVITNVCGLAVLIFASYLERFRNKKLMTIALTILSKLITLFIVIIPLLIPKPYQLYVFVPVIIIAFTLQGLTTVALNNWLAYYTPSKKRGLYISIRQTLALIVTVILSISAGKLIDSVSTPYTGFIILFSIAFLMAIFEVLVLTRIDDIRTTTSVTRYRLKDIIYISFKNKAFIRYVLYIAMFYLFLYVSDSFTIVYMMRYLELPYSTITALQLLITLPQIFMLGVWGKISDRYGHKFALKASIWFFAGETIFLALTTPSNLYICIPIAFFIAAIGNAGFVVSVFNRRYEIIPEQGRMVYDSFFNAAIGVAFIIGPALGGLFKNFFASSELLIETFQFAEIRFLYILSTIGILVVQAINLYHEKK